MERRSSNLVLGTVVCVGMMAVVGCNRSDRATISRLDRLEESAREAEVAEEELARLKEQAEAVAHGEAISDAHEHKSAGTEKTAKPTHSEAKAPKEAKPSKTEAHVKPAQKPTKAEAQAKPAKATKETASHSPAPEKASARKPASKAGAVVYVVQAGAFRVKENAEGFHGKLKKEGFPVILQQLNHSKNGPLFLVRFEPTKNVEEANSTIQNLKAKSAVDAQLIKLSE